MSNGLLEIVMCGSQDCEESAAVRVFWPGQTIDLCPEHALRAQNIASHMGFAVDVALLATLLPEPGAA